MPRSIRYLVPGYVYHLTHRCHNRRFLLKFARDRDLYCAKLRSAVLQFKVSLLNYQVTCNHTHLVVYAHELDQVSQFMHLVAGETAQAYNRRKARSGAFWEGRFHSTLVEEGRHLWNCLQYVDLNMARARAVSHPAQWKWAGYHELMGLRQRYRMLDLERLLWLLQAKDVARLRRSYEESIQQKIARDDMRRDPTWTESIAVGGAAYVARVKALINWRPRLEIQAVDDAQTTWVLRETADPQSFDP